MKYEYVYNESTGVYDHVIAIQIGVLPKGTFFTLKPLLYPKDNQVYVKDEYDFSTKKYDCHKFSDVNYFRSFKGDKIVYVDFTF